MPRPKCCRMIAGPPGCRSFGPVGMAGVAQPAVVLGLDEFEAIRLADLEGLYQEQAAEKLHVSRQTFGRIIEAARKKVAQALIEGRPLQIEGGPVQMMGMGRGRGRGFGGGGGRRRGRGWCGR